MAEFIDEEAKDLGVHVSSCRRRYDALTAKLETQDAAMRLLRNQLWAVLGLLLSGGFVTLEKVLPLLQALAKMP